MSRVVPIKNWPGYHIGDDGRVYSTKTPRGQIGGPMRELRQFDRRTRRGTASPYLSVNLTRDRRSLNQFVHTLVLEAFMGPRPEGAEACHGPGGSRDNRLVNLRWDTKEANSAERELCRGEAWQEAHAHRFSDLLS